MGRICVDSALDVDHSRSEAKVWQCHSLVHTILPMHRSALPRTVAVTLRASPHRALSLPQSPSHSNSNDLLRSQRLAWERCFAMPLLARQFKHARWVAAVVMAPEHDDESGGHQKERVLFGHADVERKRTKLSDGKLRLNFKGMRIASCLCSIHQCGCQS